PRVRAVAGGGVRAEGGAGGGAAVARLPALRAGPALRAVPPRAGAPRPLHRRPRRRRRARQLRVEGAARGAVSLPRAAERAAETVRAYPPPVPRLLHHLPRLAAPLLPGVVARGPSRGADGAPRLHLTFDDGPAEDHAALLALLGA